MSDPLLEEKFRLNLPFYLETGVEKVWLENYLESLQRHINYVREAGKRLGVPFPQLYVHDASKFEVIEFPAYARQFYGDRGDPEGFARAWLHHQNVNEHHWEYWILRSIHTKNSRVDPDTNCLPMPDRFVREMVADWMGASKAYTGSWSIIAWWGKKRETIVLHPDTFKVVIKILQEVNYGDDGD